MAIRKPATLPPSEPLTADDYYALPETPERYELFDGMLLMVPPPDFGHTSLGSRLVQAFLNYADEHGGDATGAPVGVQLGSETVLEPDALYLTPDQLGMRERRGIRGAPALVVEVSSPSTKRYDTHTKLPTYFEHGAREVWIVDPEARTVTVHSEGGRAAKTVAFGEEIPSGVVAIGTGGLERVAPLPD